MTTREALPLVGDEGRPRDDAAVFVILAVTVFGAIRVLDASVLLPAAAAVGIVAGAVVVGARRFGLITDQASAWIGLGALGIGGLYLLLLALVVVGILIDGGM